MASKIGIKLADGTFFPIMDEDPAAFETLELTTVRDNQESVQINLFKKEEGAVPEYIGSLIVEDIDKKNAGDATIALQLSMDEDKNLSAEAVDIDSGIRQALKVSLKTFDEAPVDGVDFDLNENSDDAEMNQQFSTALFYSDDEKEEEKRRSMPVWLIIILILLGVIALIMAILLVNNNNSSVAQSETSGTTIIEKETETVKETVPADNPDEEKTLQPVAEVAELPPDIPVTEPPVPNEQSVADGAASESSEDMLTESAKESILPDPVRYKLLWGDTLWDLSETYYRNPWLYKKIAAHNNLKTPDIIIAGTYIEIPPQ